MMNLFGNSKEVWRDVKDFEGLYQVSNTGKVKKIERTILKNGVFVKEGTILPLDNYGRVHLLRNGEKFKVKIEKLVFGAFSQEEAYIEPVMENMPDEVWVDVVGYEGWYQVSNYARVRSMGRMTRTVNGSLKFMRGTLLKPFRTGKGNQAYLSVRLCKDGKDENESVHRLVGFGFVPNPDPSRFDVINHLDENKYNNLPENLEWTDHQGNLQYSLGKKVEMKKSGIAKIFNSIREAYRETGISPYRIRECCDGNIGDIDGATFSLI